MQRTGGRSERPTLDERVSDLQRIVSVLTHEFREFGYELDFTPGSVAALDALLRASARSGGRPTHALRLAIGGYVGETLVRSSGGAWTHRDGGLCVRLGTGSGASHVRVFEMVERALVQPRTANLASLVRSLGK